MAGALAIALVVGDVLGAVPWDPIWSARLAGILTTHGGAGEVQNYALFTTVQSDKLAVTTGTRFASSGNPRITGEWCYVEHPIADNDRRTVTLAAIDEAGKLVRTEPTPSVLSALGLNATQFSRLIDSHCRFQTDGED